MGATDRADAAVVSIRPAGEPGAAVKAALIAVHRHLGRTKLATNTVKAYKRQTSACVDWLTASRRPSRRVRRPGRRGSRRHRLAAPPHTRQGLARTVNQALAAIALMYSHAGLRVFAKRARVPRPGEPNALARTTPPADRLRHRPGRPGHRCRRGHRRTSPPSLPSHLRHPPPARRRGRRPGPGPARSRLHRHCGPVLPYRVSRNAAVIERIFDS
jgi:hypothetical protein